jgi:hypothetical protein
MPAATGDVAWRGPPHRTGGVVQPGNAVNSFTVTRACRPPGPPHSPTVTDGACLISVSSSLCPRTLMRRTQKPFSALW